MELHALTPIDEINLRIAKIRSAMAQQNLDAILITDNANIYYVTGRVINGYVYRPTVMSLISSDAQLS
jgi:Xaa-Pro aminopeptidase